MNDNAKVKEISLAIDSPHCGSIVALHFVGHVLVGDEPGYELKIEPYPTGGKWASEEMCRVTIVSREDVIAFAQYDTAAAIAGEVWVRLICRPRGPG